MYNAQRDRVYCVAGCVGYPCVATGTGKLGAGKGYIWDVYLGDLGSLVLSLLVLHFSFPSPTLHSSLLLFPTRGILRRRQRQLDRDLPLAWQSAVRRGRPEASALWIVHLLLVRNPNNAPWRQEAGCRRVAPETGDRASYGRIVGERNLWSGRGGGAGVWLRGWFLWVRLPVARAHGRVLTL
ncbi:hypothetical protein B0T20DRAFT_392356 [Sordaria brevicollis]|uniref:Uncharacterized protein n=1 Tax=Sordaria brevicollis TaxID=83679 RepID=A0AAE0PG29_SORBR|nr:hypothetical protein B0T20DRAFT_392356 [Sordaria brevicollis]